MAVSPRDVFEHLAIEVRTRTLQLLGHTPASHLTWAPPGTSNHVLWHAGHALWLQDVLCIQVVTGKSELPAGWAELFGMGSEPSRPRRPWPGRDEVAGHLQAQLTRLLAVLDEMAGLDLDARPPFAHRGDPRSLRACVTHGLHDEANHQGEMYLLLKMRPRA